MAFPLRALALSLATLPAMAFASDYIGSLKIPRLAQPGDVYSFSTLPPSGLANPPSVEPYRLKLGYQYTRYLAIEGELNDLPRSPSSVFGNGTALVTPAVRSTGFGVDTVARLSWWRLSLYGRVGAYRGEAGLPFAIYSTSLLGNTSDHTHVRYGLGLNYDITSSVGIRAQVDHYSPIASPFSGEPEGDVFSVGVSWRF
jgi:hypothetical protein